MSHVRTQLRQAAAAALASVAPVSTSRVYPVEQVELPALLCATRTPRRSTGGTMGAFERTVELVVECLAKGPFVDDDLDTLAAAVETAINRSTLGGLTRPLVPIKFAVSIETGNTTIGRLRMVYRAVYHTAFASPETAV